MDNDRKQLILVVDDDIQLLDVLHKALEERGFAVITASTGKRALEMLENTTPDLFIIDLKMEPMNGFDFYQRIRKIHTFAKTPAFFFTGVNEALAERFSKTLGVESYISKPVEMDVLEAHIRKALSH